MNTDKMDSSAVYALFEEIKQRVTDLGNKTSQTETASTIDNIEITALREDLRKLTNQKTFTPEQVKVFHDSLGNCAVQSIKMFEDIQVKGFEKVVKFIAEIYNIFEKTNCTQN